MSLSPQSPQGGSDLANPGRRRVLVSAGMIAAAAALLPWAKMAYAEAPAQASAAELAGFLALSKRLTSRPNLDAGVSERIYVALSAGDRAFGPRVAALTKAMDDANISDMRKFNESAVASDASMKALAIEIVHAWYLGYTGTPGSGTTDDATFITYTGALMYESTQDVTVIPTYARAGTNYWTEAPASIATD
ncbi:D-sorbitol dehydrogenase-like protein [Luteibacter rhizovicinus]|uniref:D-sorbitol dehydrogenase-like protein n=1 Tax=Luteibacter rhizovicinus TaxID=242606 RepID=A0A4R3YIB1_9GAMM|nr:sugar dehydrogenase complex small subunit [Luteibacter rhizovicinus]TCV92087.1 D-sorbitol dehydrogenase-like protein [Luteibacter rhizovicinus]